MTVAQSFVAGSSEVTKASMYYDAGAQRIQYLGTGIIPKHSTLMTMPMGGDDQLRLAIGYGGLTIKDSHNSEA